MANPQLKLSILSTLLIALLLINGANGKNYIKNGDFKSFTSITQIDHWIVSNAPFYTTQSANNDWLLEKNPKGSGYYLSLNHQYAVQTISSLPAGAYRLKIDFAYRQGSAPFILTYGVKIGTEIMYNQAVEWDSKEYIHQLNIEFYLSQISNAIVSIYTGGDKVIKFTNVMLQPLLPTNALAIPAILAKPENGINYVKNGNFKSFTSITQIDHWMVVDTREGTTQSTQNNWVLEKNPAGSNYYLSMSSQYVVQTISSLPAGSYTLKTDVAWRQDDSFYSIQIGVLIGESYYVFQPTWYSKEYIGQAICNFYLPSKSDVKVFIITINDKIVKITNVTLYPTLQTLASKALATVSKNIRHDCHH